MSSGDPNVFKGTEHRAMFQGHNTLKGNSTKFSYLKFVYKFVEFSFLLTN